MKWILTLLLMAAVLALVGVSALANQRPGGGDERQLIHIAAAGVDDLRPDVDSPRPLAAGI